MPRPANSFKLGVDSKGDPGGQTMFQAYTQKFFVKFRQLRQR